MGITVPIFPTIGSKITAAISWPSESRVCRNETVSLYSRTIVSFETPVVTPGESGTPRVAAAEPAATKSESTCPW